MKLAKIAIIEFVLDTQAGICIYCRKCTERHKQLEKEAEILCRKWGIDVENLKETMKEKKENI